MTETALTAPPARGGRPPSQDWISVAEKLRDNPDSWYPVAEDTLANVAGKISRGEIAAFRVGGGERGHFEAVSRELSKESGYRRGTIWAAYILDEVES